MSPHRARGGGLSSCLPLQEAAREMFGGQEASLHFSVSITARGRESRPSGRRGRRGGLRWPDGHQGKLSGFMGQCSLPRAGTVISGALGVTWGKLVPPPFSALMEVCVESCRVGSDLSVLTVSRSPVFAPDRGLHTLSQGVWRKDTFKAKVSQQGVARRAVACVISAGVCRAPKRILLRKRQDCRQISSKSTAEISLTMESMWE